MGMTIGQPPALLAALAARVQGGALADLDLWYFHSMPQAGKTILRYELLDRVRPHCMFMTGIERALIARGAAEGRDVVDFTPCAFSESPCLLTERVALDAFVVTVSPMDRHGWFTFGTNNDYATAAARSARDRVNADYRSVLVITDLSPSSRHALEASVRLFPETQLALCHAYDIPFAGYLENAAVQADFTRYDAEATERFMAEANLPAGAAASIRRIVERGDPETLLADHAARAAWV
ncbi:MAG: universal stress protein [Sphingomonas sp.]|nr:universal stress protein [Sphingomonas sp.]